MSAPSEQRRRDAVDALIEETLSVYCEDAAELLGLEDTPDVVDLHMTAAGYSFSALYDAPRACPTHGVVEDRGDRSCAGCEWAFNSDPPWWTVVDFDAGRTLAAALDKVREGAPTWRAKAVAQHAMETREALQ